MGGLRKFVAAAGAVLLLISGFVVFGPTTPAGGSETGFSIGSFPPDAGVIRLHMQNDGDYFRFDRVDGSGGYTDGAREPIVQTSCNITSTFPSVTLGRTPNNPKSKLGIFDHGIGVQVQGEGNGQPCGRLDGTQTLTVGLGESLAGKYMDFVELDLEAKFGATIKVELLDGSTVLHTFTHFTGGPDSGPDSADGDNFRVRVPPDESTLVFFTAVRLSVVNGTGSVSLEGGVDGTKPWDSDGDATNGFQSLGGELDDGAGTSDSLFHVVDIDGFLECGGTASEGGGTTPGASIELLATDECEAVPYSLDSSTGTEGQLISFQKPETDHNEYRATFTWTIEESAYPVPVTEIDYPDDGLGPLRPEFCAGTFEDPSLPANYAQSWCVVSHSAELVETGFMQVTEEFFGVGDPLYLR